MESGEDTQVVRSFGIEEELLLVDPDTGHAVAAVETVLRSAAEHVAKTSGPVELRLDREVKKEQIEIVSPPCTTIEEIARQITMGRYLVDQAAITVDARAAALATSVLPSTPQPAQGERYQRMRAEFGLIFAEQLTCGFHVHVSIDSQEEGIGVLDRIRPWLPAILAVSTNSPFWNGRDSGFLSFRYQVWNRWPTAGAYNIFGSAQSYREELTSLLDTGVLLDVGMIYFDARLSARYPTVEVRVADVCMSAEDAVAVASLVRALVETAAQEWRNGIPPASTPTSVLELAMWAASHTGIGRDLLDPITGAPCNAESAVQRLLEHVASTLIRYHDYEFVVTSLARILKDGTGADRQRRVFQRTRSLPAVVKDAVCATHSSPCQ